jgi:photosystem II stability/assembly factor-like uncharacterized protein
LNRSFFLALLIVTLSSAQSQSLQKESYRLAGGFSPGPAGNGIIDLTFENGRLYVAADEGIAITEDAGATWLQSTHANGIGKGGVSAIDVKDKVIWIATGYDTIIDKGYLPAGGGVGYSTDSGESWQWFRQPVDARDVEFYKPTTTHIQNITFDLAITEDAVWIASFGGGLRKSEDMGQSWQVVTVDGIPFDAYGYLTHRAFSVFYDGEALWVGTAGGIHKSLDGGATWTTFNHRNEQSISGNFVVAIGHQRTSARDIIWASTWPTTTESGDQTEFKAVSKSEDGGLTWETILRDESAHNFAFDDSLVYIATDHGVFMSPDYGETWAVYPVIFDASANRTIYDSEINTVSAGPAGTLWIGTSDGLGMTSNNGLTWKVIQVFIQPGSEGVPRSYACPNPFSPLRDRLLNAEGHCRFVYHAGRPTRTTVTLYDYEMNRVTALDYQVTQPGMQSEPVWNGKNDLGDLVAIGVYFYRIRVEGEGEYWGKVMVVN